MLSLSSDSLAQLSLAREEKKHIHTQNTIDIEIINILCMKSVLLSPSLPSRLPPETRDKLIHWRISGSKEGEEKKKLSQNKKKLLKIYHCSVFTPKLHSHRTYEYSFECGYFTRSKVQNGLNNEAMKCGRNMNEN